MILTVYIFALLLWQVSGRVFHYEKGTVRIHLTGSEIYGKKTVHHKAWTWTDMFYLLDRYDPDRGNALEEFCRDGEILTEAVFRNEKLESFTCLIPKGNTEQRK